MGIEGGLEKIPYTGKFFESDNFGECTIEDTGHLPYEEAVEQVKDNQPGNPTDPGVRFANDLHTEVAEELGLGDDYSPLSFYTSVGSALDHYHGVDGFFEFEDSRVTLDITQNPAKSTGYKADFMIGPEEVEYSTRRQEKAREIAQSLREQQKARNEDIAGERQIRRLKRFRPKNNRNY